jgi:hypothetical protein
MLNNKLIRFLMLLSDAQLEHLMVFLKSPYFNTNQHLVALMEYLLPFAPVFNHPALSYQNAYTHIFKLPMPEPDAKVAITKLSSKLLKLGEQYLEHASLREHPFEGAYFRKKWYRKIHKPEWEEAALRDMNIAQAKYPLKDEYKAYCAYLIEYEQAKLVSTSVLVAEKFDLSKVNTALDHYYLRAKLECLCHMTNHAMVSGQYYDLKEISAVTQLLALREQQIDAATLIWNKALALLNQPDSKSCYLALKTAQKEHAPYLSIPENQTIFIYLSHSARKAFSDQEEYLRELMHLHIAQMEAGCLLTDGYIYPINFLNIIYVAIQQKEIAWANAFFQEFEPRLDPSSDKSPDIRLFCQSILYFENGEYEAALNALNGAYFKDIQLKLSERRLRLKIYLELGYIETFLDQINTFRKFLSVNKNIISDHHMEGSKAFIQAAYSIYKAEQERDKSLKMLQKMMAESPVLPERSWIEHKIRGMAY